MTQRGRYTLTVALILLASAALLLPGCRSKKPKKRHKTLHGVVTYVDLTTGDVAMDWFNPKKSKTIQVTGRVTKDTDIYIDGKLAAITDIKIGDPVIVEGYIQGADAVAERVTIDHGTGKTINRPEPVTTTQPVGT